MKSRACIDLHPDHRAAQ